MRHSLAEAPEYRKQYAVGIAALYPHWHPSTFELHASREAFFVDETGLVYRGPFGDEPDPVYMPLADWFSEMYHLSPAEGHRFETNGRILCGCGEDTWTLTPHTGGVITVCAGCGHAIKWED